MCNLTVDNKVEVVWMVVVLLSYFVVEYDGLAPTRLENTTINTLLAEGDGDLDGSVILL